MWQDVSKTKPYPVHTVVEITDNEEHSAEFEITIPSGQTLEIRAANHFRPLLRVPDISGQEVEKCRITGEAGSRLVLDGLLFGDGEIQFDGEFASITIRHCTFTPGRTRLTFKLNETEVRFEKCIIGEIETRAPDPKQVSRRDKKREDCPPRYNEPIRLCITDSILDGQHSEYVLSGSDHTAHAHLKMVRTTSFGQVKTHAVDLVEDSLLCDHVCVENVLTGCIRFSYVAPGSCTPSPFHGQPALAIRRLDNPVAGSQPHHGMTADAEAMRVTPQFVSTNYGHCDYARLRDECAQEILMGASDEGEMGAYHNEFFSQRAVHLRRRLQEFVPAGSDAEIIFEN